MLFLDTVIQCKTDFPQAECMKQKEFIAIPQAERDQLFAIKIPAIY